MWGKESSGEELDKVIVEEKEKELTKKDKLLRLEKEAPCEWGPVYKKKKIQIQGSLKVSFEQEGWAMKWDHINKSLKEPDTE